jgi:dihydrofolate reductase
MEISVVAAISRNHCIGVQGRLPWHFPEDLAHFKNLTLGHVVLMGRKTWESIPDSLRPLTQRINVVLTRSKAYSLPDGVLSYDCLEQALEDLKALGHVKIMVIGGASLFHWALGRAEFLYITKVHHHVDGDVFFPVIPAQHYKCIEIKPSVALPGVYEFQTYQRRLRETI